MASCVSQMSRSIQIFRVTATVPQGTNVPWGGVQVAKVQLPCSLLIQTNIRPMACMVYKKEGTSCAGGIKLVPVPAAMRQVYRRWCNIGCTATASWQQSPSPNFGLLICGAIQYMHCHQYSMQTEQISYLGRQVGFRRLDQNRTDARFREIDVPIRGFLWTSLPGRGHEGLSVASSRPSLLLSYSS